ncbi:helix-turn-helix domain-containing protein [Oceanospirillum sanctuarii]|uniref:helix-turn-helix domain-containing protein n=1 Tax=Oceanospirillum sanctuarii TaxID=1434821 RepID=UPI000A3B7A90|nr:helix-turn-helix domain-containing protein [Oceanospirillum sanctuarii]
MSTPNTHTVLITSAQAAEALGFSEYTLRLSRTTGKLAGVQAPPFLKVGRSVRYKQADLFEWLAQFDTFTNTAQAEMAAMSAA